MYITFFGGRDIRIYREGESFYRHFLEPDVLSGYCGICHMHSGILQSYPCSEYHMIPSYFTLSIVNEAVHMAHIAIPSQRSPM